MYLIGICRAGARSYLLLSAALQYSFILRMLYSASLTRSVRCGVPKYRCPWNLSFRHSWHTTSSVREGTTGVLADDVVYYAVDRTHGHAYHANSAIAGPAHPDATSTADREYMAQTAPAPSASAAAAMDVYADTA